MTILRTFNYRGKKLEISACPEQAGDPSLGAQRAEAFGLRAPGSGQISIHSLQAAARRGASGVKVILKGIVEGGPIAHVAAELLLYDREQGLAYGPVHTQYLAASQYRPAAGGLIPVWKTPLRVQVELPAGLRLVSDGANASLARLAPQQAGALGSRLVLQTDGEYTPAGEQAPRRAQTVFGSDRRLKDLIVYVRQGAAQMPRAHQPAPGDRFTPHVRVFKMNADFRPESESPAQGNGLSFGSAALHWYAAPMMPGDYLVGLAVIDLDGGVQRAYAPVSLA